MTGYRLCDFSLLSFDILIVGLNVGQEIPKQINEMFCCCLDMRFRDCLLPFWSLKTIQVAKKQRSDMGPLLLLLFISGRSCDDTNDGESAD